ncbi:MAG TPA: hypothetical protein VI320_38425 [Terracidiphilus sp.]
MGDIDTLESSPLTGDARSGTDAVLGGNSSARCRSDIQKQVSNYPTMKMLVDQLING